MKTFKEHLTEAASDRAIHDVLKSHGWNAESDGRKLKNTTWFGHKDHPEHSMMVRHHTDSFKWAHDQPNYNMKDTHGRDFERLGSGKDAASLDAHLKKFHTSE